jgi:hypothetical protein
MGEPRGYVISGVNMHGAIVFIANLSAWPWRCASRFCIV